MVRMALPPRARALKGGKKSKCLTYLYSTHGKCHHGCRGGIHPAWGLGLLIGQGAVKGQKICRLFIVSSPRIKGLKTLLNGMDELFVFLYFYIVFVKNRGMRLVRTVRGLFVVVRSHLWVGRDKAGFTFALAFMESALLLLSAC